MKQFPRLIPLVTLLVVYVANAHQFNSRSSDFWAYTIGGVVGNSFIALVGYLIAMRVKSSSPEQDRVRIAVRTAWVMCALTAAVSLSHSFGFR